MKASQKVVSAVLLFFLCSLGAFSLEFNLRPVVVGSLPTDDYSMRIYTLGFGGFVDADLNLFGFLSVGPEFGYFMNPLKINGVFSQTIAGGLNAGIYLYPLSRLSLRAGGTGGIYQLSNGDRTYSGIWWKAYGEIGFRISPSLNLSAGGGYLSLNGNPNPMYTGVIAGLSLQITFDTATAAGNLTVSVEQPEPVFPLFYGMYKQTSIGTIKIVNDESAEVRNVSVGFRAGNYTSSLMPCGSVRFLQRRESVSLPLYADFSDVIQSFTENGKIPGQIVISYEFLGEQRTVEKTAVLSVYNRNAVRWMDLSALAAFISPNSPEVLDFSKYILGIARDNLKTGLNRNMQFAMFLYEGLKVGGITYSADIATPYASYHRDSSLLDYVQYPFQTLSFESGDYDDIGILYAAALESVGIRTALIPLDEDFVVAFSLGITAEEAENLFNGIDNLISIADELWMPLSVSTLKEGFINSWNSAMKNIVAASESGAELNFIILQDAWKTYPPSGIRDDELKFQKPPQVMVEKEAALSLARYVSSEFGPKIRAVQEEIRSSGGTAQLYNRLGLLYIRAGLYQEAKVEYAKAAALQSVTAMVNLGNIGLIQKDFRTAGVWFKRALELQPDNKAALNGSAQVDAELGQE